MKVRRRIGRGWFALSAACLMMAWCGVARADADDWQLSARGGIASVVVEGRDPMGARLALDGQYGLDDAWAIRLTASGSRHDVSTDMAKALPGGAIYAYSLFGGLAYTMDVLRLLPSFEVGIGILGIKGAVVKPHRAIGMQAAVGADYMMGPRWSIGGVAEYVFAPLDLISNALTGNAVPQAFALSMRFCWILQ
ncbi:MAG: outer membrane beta-barrel protein [Deltaproteobacteria bacterium]|nr:outer membrane beta-barrel protein [Deltaproteobacteria bacterium]